MVKSIIARVSIDISRERDKEIFTTFISPKETSRGFWNFISRTFRVIVLSYATRSLIPRVSKKPTARSMSFHLFLIVKSFTLEA